MAKKKEKERNDIRIENNTAVWDMSLQGDVEGTYIGQFRFRCLITPTQRLAASREYRELLGDNPTFALQHDDNLAFALAQLKYRIISAPPFWSSTLQTTGMAGDLADENIIMATLAAAVDAEVIYKNRLKERRLEAIEKAKKAAEKAMNATEDFDGESEETADQS